MRGIFIRKLSIGAVCVMLAGCSYFDADGGYKAPFYKVDVTEANHALEKTEEGYRFKSNSGHTGFTVNDQVQVYSVDSDGIVGLRPAEGGEVNSGGHQAVEVFALDSEMKELIAPSQVTADGALTPSWHGAAHKPTSKPVPLVMPSVPVVPVESE